MNFLVIGSGTAGAISCMRLLSLLPDSQVKCVYTKSKDAINVGESSTPILPQALFHCNIDLLNNLNDFDGTVKLGLKFINWSDKDFFHPFNGTIGIHMNSAKFSWHIIDKLKKNYSSRFEHEENKVINVENFSDKVIVEFETEKESFDYIVDCSGFIDMNSNPDYLKTSFKSVNSALVYNSDPVDELYTSHYAHKNGWMFGIPLKNRKANGYLYNRNITTKQEAIKDMQQHIPEASLDNTRHLEWNSYYKKEPVKNRVIYNGNKLMFFEPLQALSLNFYIGHIDNVINCIVRNSFNGYIDYYNDQVKLMEAIIALHYYGNNGPYKNSKFWNTMKKRSKKILNSNKFFDWYKDLRYDSYGSFSRKDAEYIINGMNIPV